MDAADRFDALGQDLRCTTNRVEIHTARFSAGRQGTIPHPAFANNTPDTKLPNDITLVRFLTDGRGRTRRRDFPAAMIILDHDRTAVVKDAILEVHARWKFAAFMEILVDGVTSGEDHSGDQDFVADLQGPDRGFSEWGTQLNHAQTLAAAA